MRDDVTLHRAREAVAARYPATLTDTLGRVHRCIPHDAILRGDWDGGALVREEMARREWHG